MSEQIANRLRKLQGYGPVAVITREAGYIAEQGISAPPIDPDQRRKYRLGHQLLDIAIAGDEVRITVAAPDGPRPLPLDQIEQVTVDHPLGHRMPLTGKQVMKPCLMPWNGHENVLRWVPRAYERFWGGHSYDVLESGVETDHPHMGYVRGYDISAPSLHDLWPRNTSLETAKWHKRPYSLFLVSLLRPADGEIPLTVITSRFGYEDMERKATILPPKDYPMPERQVAAWDIPKQRTDEEVQEIHLSRVGLLSTEHGPAVPPRLMDVDDAYLYATHD